MFYCCTRYEGLGIGSWNTSSVTDMYAMFFRCSNFNAEIMSWDTSSITDISHAFQACSGFDQDLSRWDTSSVEKAIWIFQMTNRAWPAARRPQIASTVRQEPSRYG